MKATITDRKQKFSSSHRKEKAGLHKSYAMLVQDTITPGEARAVAELRIYWPANNPFACLWISAPGKSGKRTECPKCNATWEANHSTCPKCLHQPAPLPTAPAEHRQGSGTAGGGGCCKLSAAAGEAIRNAGFDLSENIEGVGTSAVRDAMRAIADALGYPEAMLFETHP